MFESTGLHLLFDVLCCVDVVLMLQYVDIGLMLVFVDVVGYIALYLSRLILYIIVLRLYRHLYTQSTVVLL